MTPDDIASALASVLDADITDVRRLTGGASRETWAFRADGEPLVLQRERAGSPRAGAMPREAALVRVAAAAGVPVAAVVAAGAEDGGLGTGYLVSRFVDGETIARRILRDDAYADARPVLTAQCGRALAAIHRIPPDAVDGLERTDQLAEYRRVLDELGDPVPAFELAFRWLADNRPPGTGEAVVHGDFRLGNLMVGPDGLRAVVDWELAHIGDPMEDLGWLCVRAWRFGGSEPVAGVGGYDELFGAYASAAEVEVDPAVVRWWEVLGTLKWGIMCILQARAHLDGWSRSVELAAIGRRACENEHDLLLLLAPEALADAAARSLPEPAPGPSTHGRPTAAELVEAVREWIERDVRDETTGSVRFHARVAAKALGIVERELTTTPPASTAADEAALAAGIRDGSIAVDDDVVAGIADTVMAKLRVANPTHP